MTHEQILPFVTTYHPGVNNLIENNDAQIEFYSKSVIAEDHFQKAAYFRLQKRKKLDRTKL